MLTSRFRQSTRLHLDGVQEHLGPVERLADTLASQVRDRHVGARLG